MGWSIVQAAMSFNIGVLLSLGGVVVLTLAYLRSRDTSTLFLLIWTAVIFVSTWQHVRYEYYIAVNVALLSAIFVTSIKMKWVGLTLALLFVALSLYSISTIPTLNNNDDFKDSLIWLSNNSPNPNIDYDKIYNQPFTYPDNSYSVMSWWDYGHAITYYARRIPVSNPFQQGVAGPVGAANYFMSTNLTVANTILDYHHTKYVIVNDKMATNDLWAMAAWANVTPDYNETMVVRLNRGTVPGYTLVHEVGTVKTFEYKGVV
jgi:dolichyl-diphosphooligosaccharide--protein glycosyltransferase